MANLGSEVSRMFSYGEKGEKELAEKSFGRAKSTILRMFSLPEAQARKGELEMMADVLDDYQREKPKYRVKKETFKRYFLPFAQRILNRL